MTTFLTNKAFSSAFIALSLLFSLSPSVESAAVRPGFDSEAFSPSDEESVEITLADFGLSNLTFLGTNYASIFVNNDGNVTFGVPLTVFPLSGNIADVTSPILAPFFADIDTRNPDSGVVSYGAGTVDIRPAFGVNWPGVSYFAFSGDKFNNFQLVLIDRSDLNPGDFDIEFNYNQIQWETGDFQGGNAGLGGNSAQVGLSSNLLAGSGIAGSFLDNGPNALVSNSLNTNEPGRYIFSIRNQVDPPLRTPEPVSLFSLSFFVLTLRSGFSAKKSNR